MRIGIIAGEASGDILASGLIKAIQQHYPDVQFEGIAGPLMIQAGCQAIYPAEKLSVMGLVEVLAHYRELSSIRRELIHYFIANPPDVFIGIDAPDFNLDVEAALKEQGISTGLTYIPLHLLTYYKQKYKLKITAYGNALNAYGQILSLPMYPSLSNDDVKYICDNIKKISKEWI